jgi:DNA-binding CsgD family transcriptional regulator
MWLVAVRAATMAGASELVLDLLEGLGCGGIFLDKRGRVTHTNERARRYLGAQFNIKRRGGNPAANTMNNEVQDGLRAALGESARIAPIFGEYIVVPRTAARPLLLRNLLVPKSSESAADTLTAVVVLDMEDCPHPDEELLREVFLLTPAEARLARRMSCGEDLGSIANDLGVTRGTLRVQLKSLFWKTATRRQGELIALLAHLSKLQGRK